MAAVLTDVVHYLDQYLRVREVPDDPRALNGLQVENDGPVTRVVAAVDACQATIDRAAELGADLMLVHHGLFWAGLEAVAGPYRRRLQGLLCRRIALYAAHLPLDCHPEVGNNALLAGRIGLANPEPFGSFEGIRIGVAGDLVIDRPSLAARIGQVLGTAPRVIATGPERVKRLGIVTGAGGSALREAAMSGLDTLVTGEGAHHTFLQAEELKMNLIYAGHYATETIGVQALAAHVSRRFEIPWEFADHPTGM